MTAEATCSFCEKPVSPDQTHYRKVAGWARNDARSGSLSLREYLGEVAHPECVNERRGAGARPARVEDKQREDITLDDLDRAILARLPDLGTKKGLYLADTRTVPRLIKELRDPHLTTIDVTARVRVLHRFGYVSEVGHKTDGSANWQRTEKGKREAMDTVTT